MPSSPRDSHLPLFLRFCEEDFDLRRGTTHQLGERFRPLLQRQDGWQLPDTGLTLDEPFERLLVVFRRVSVRALQVELTPHDVVESEGRVVVVQPYVHDPPAGPKEPKGHPPRDLGANGVYDEVGTKAFRGT